MGIGIITNFNVNTSKNIDARLGPYASVEEATGSIDSLFRHIGMTVTITGSGTPIDYWFNPTTNNTDLVIKSTGGVTGGSSNYIAKWSGATSLTTSSIRDVPDLVTVNANLTISGSKEWVINHNGNIAGTINPIVLNSIENQVDLFNFSAEDATPSYRSVFVDYYMELIDVTDNKLIKSSKSGTIKAAIFYIYVSGGGSPNYQFLTTENSTPEFIREYTENLSINDATLENVVFSFYKDGSGKIVFRCTNNNTDTNFNVSVRGEYKLLIL
jgi:hypothetical protein